jgi:hypothetical protein
MILIPVQCPYCHSDHVIKGGVLSGSILSVHLSP